MTNNSQSPREYDAVLGGNSPPPIYGAVLSGIEGLKGRLETGNKQQRVESLADAIKYGDAGIDLLIEALNDGEIEIRAKAFQLLQNVESGKVKQIVNKGIPLKKGDKLYSVYESIIDYNDYCYDLIDYIDDEDDYYDFEGQLLSQHILKENAEAVALKYHCWRTLKEDILEIGWNECDGLREKFNIISWCKNHNIPIRLPDESNSQFEQRLIAKLNNIKVSQHIYQDVDINKYNWDIRNQLEVKTINYLKENHKFELLGQLWFDAVGKLAFVHEESIEKETYLKA
ncbi:MAG: hypothetical protein WBA07_12940 [Rivularia sp. (in: cyanobacteria)]